MDPFVAEIRMFGGNFAPRGWAFCNGQVLSISQNTALFSLVGTTYGGNGTTTFALPNLQNCTPMHAGNGPGLTPRQLGETGGVPTVTLLSSQMPQHNHALVATAEDGRFASPANNLLGAGTALYSAAAPNATLSPQSLPLQGGSQPHENRQPYLGITFIIALQGVFPQRS